MVQQRHEAAGDGVARGVVAGRHQQSEEVVELEVAERGSVRRGRQQAGYDVVGGLGPAERGGGLGVAEHLEAGRAAERDQPELLGVGEIDDVVGVFRVGVREQLVAPDHELFGVGVGHPQQAAEHAHGQLPGDLGDEVELVVPQRIDDDRAGQIADGVGVPVDRVAGEAPVHQAPQAGVVGRIEFHHRAPGLGLLGVHLLEADAPAGCEGVPGVVRPDDVVIARDRPEAGAVGLVPPRDGILVAQPIERGVGHAGHERVVAGEVGVAVVARRGPGMAGNHRLVGQPPGRRAGGQMPGAIVRRVIEAWAPASCLRSRTSPRCASSRRSSPAAPGGLVPPWGNRRLRGRPRPGRPGPVRCRSPAW